MTAHHNLIIKFNPYLSGYHHCHSGNSHCHPGPRAGIHLIAQRSKQRAALLKYQGMLDDVSRHTT